MKNLFLTLLILSTLYLIPAPSHAALSDGLVGYWTFDGPHTSWTSATAGTTKDLTSNGNTGTMTNMSQSTSPVIGKIGQGLKFDGTNSFVNTNSGTGIIDAQQSVTISAWVYPTSAGSYPGIVVKSSAWAEVTAKYALELYSNTLRPKVYMGGTGTTEASAIPLNKWTHIVFTNGPGGYVIYENGASNVNGGALPAPTTSSDSWKIGAWVTSGGSGFFPGRIDDVRIYNRALSASEVNQLYKFGAAKLAVSPVQSLTSGLVGYWTFDG
ncbi:MAG: LamG domain-containing protein, partial [Nanoarchaeota archaeon]